MVGAEPVHLYRGETNLVFRPRKPKAIRTLQVAAGNVRCEMRSED